MNRLLLGDILKCLRDTNVIPHASVIVGTLHETERA